MTAHIGQSPIANIAAEPVRRRLLNNTAGAISPGDVLNVDMSAVLNGEFYRVSVPVTADAISGVAVVAGEAIAVGAYGLFYEECEFDVLCAAAGSIGAKLSLTNTTKTLTATAATQKVVAIQKSARNATTLKAKVMFSGRHGFGNLA